MAAALERAAERAEIASETAAARADVLTAIVIGINVAARDADDDAEAQRLISSARNEIARWSDAS